MRFTSVGDHVYRWIDRPKCLQPIACTVICVDETGQIHPHTVQVRDDDGKEHWIDTLTLLTPEEMERIMTDRAIKQLDPNWIPPEAYLKD